MSQSKLTPSFGAFQLDKWFAYVKNWIKIFFTNWHLPLKAPSFVFGLVQYFPLGFPSWWDLMRPASRSKASWFSSQVCELEFRLNDISINCCTHETLLNQNRPARWGHWTQPVWFFPPTLHRFCCYIPSRVHQPKLVALDDSCRGSGLKAFPESGKVLAFQSELSNGFAVIENGQ